MVDTLRIFFSAAHNVWMAESGWYLEDGSFEIDSAGELNSADQVDYFFSMLDEGDTVAVYTRGDLPEGEEYQRYAAKEV